LKKPIPFEAFQQGERTYKVIDYDVTPKESKLLVKMIIEYTGEKVNGSPYWREYPLKKGFHEITIIKKLKL
jgi:hypothetical protein